VIGEPGPKLFGDAAKAAGGLGEGFGLAIVWRMVN
jgi:hypothetical protein